MIRPVSTSESTPPEAPPRPLKVGGIDYLNAQPLLYCLKAASRWPVALEEHRPRDLASRLQQGQLDVALVPVVAAGESPEYRVLPGVGISSYGDVRSIRLYHRVPARSLARVALDSSSRTSVLLLRLLCRQVWHCTPEFVDQPPGEIRRWLEGPRVTDVPFDGVLLIGDAALECQRRDGWDEIDLGREWTRWTGLPFVYAFWVARHGVASAAELAEDFQRARDLGVARIDDIVAGVRLPEGVSPSSARHYLRQVIEYDLREDKLEGLGLFFRELDKAGLVDGIPEGVLDQLSSQPDATS